LGFFCYSVMATKTGYLIKEGGGIKTWKKRWCVLKNNVIYYSKAMDASSEIGAIRLEKVDPNRVFASNRKLKKYSGLCFEVPTPERTYYLVTSSEKERDEWIEALRSSINERIQSGRRDTYSDEDPASPGEEANVKPIGPDDFELLYLIGKGSFGKVFQVRKKDTGRIYAMKVLNKQHILENKEMEHTKAEKNILQKLIHPFLVNLNYSFQTPERLFFIMDYVNGGELFTHLQREGRFSPERVKFYAAEIILGLEYLHNSGIIYRDLKPENILLNAEGHIRLTDFGISKEGLVADNATTQTLCGTPDYLAPEILTGNPYTKMVDWWSFGCLVYGMTFGIPPFEADNMNLLFNKILYDAIKFPSQPSADDSTKNFILALLERDTNKRLGAPAIKKHGYFRDVDFEAIISLEVSPPFKPGVKGPEDVSMVDPIFLNEKAVLDDGPAAPAPGGKKQPITNDIPSDFDGFTFVQPTSKQ